MANYSELLQGALLLNEQERAILAEKLLASLDEIPPEEVEQLWLDEAERRLASFRNGTAKTVSSDEVSQSIRPLFR